MASIPQCSICTHDARAELEQILVRGSQSVRAVARSYEVSRDALRRHIARHVPGSDRILFEGVEGASALDLADSIRDSIQHLVDVRADADRAGDSRTAIQASKAIIAARVLLADRLGVSSVDVLSELRDSDAVITATLAISKTTPAFAEILAKQLREQGDSALSATVQGHADRQRAALAASSTGEAPS